MVLFLSRYVYKLLEEFEKVLARVDFFLFNLLYISSTGCLLTVTIITIINQDLCFCTLSDRTNGESNGSNGSKNSILCTQ